MARHSRINTDIDPIFEIDIEKASKDRLIEYLCQTIHYEVEKGEDADCDFIRECSDWLSELTADVIVFTPEELKARLERVKNCTGTNRQKPSRIHHVDKRKVFARVTILVASLILLSFLSLSALAMNAGYDSTWEYISMNVGKLFGLQPGQNINEGYITVFKNEKVVKYDNMNELLNAESLSILYPHVLPNDINITKLCYIYGTDDQYTIRFIFSNNTYAFDISNYCSIQASEFSEPPPLSVNGMDFYITQKDDGICFALLQADGYEYTIKSPNYEDLLIIINSMKG